MTLFWIVAALLVAASLLFIIPPLFQQRESEETVARRAVNVTIYKNQLEELDADLASGDVSQEQYDKSRQEIERRLLEDASAAEAGEAKSGRNLSIGTSVLVAVVVPVVAIMMYFNVGNPEALDPTAQTQQAASPHGDETNMAMQIEAMVAQLANRLQQNPADIEGWVMLGRSYSVLGRYPEAVKAYEAAIQFVGDNPDILTDYADAVAMTSGESLEGKPLELLQRALKANPNHQKALWLVGTALFERGDFAGAIEYWSHLMKMVPPGSQDAEAMQANIAEARAYRERQLKGEFGVVPPTTHLPEGTATAVAKAANVSGRVIISSKLAGKFSPDDTLFIYAKAVSGPAMPLAIIRAQASELPIEFSLDESMAMMPTMSLARFDQVVVGARISKSGNAIAQSGDLEGKTQAVAVGTSGLNITIDSIIP